MGSIFVGKLSHLCFKFYEFVGISVFICATKLAYIHNYSFGLSNVQSTLFFHQSVVVCC